MQVYNKIGNGKRIKERDKRITKEKKEENATPVIQAQAACIHAHAK